MPQKSIFWGASLLLVIAIFYRFYFPLAHKSIAFSTKVKSAFITQKETITNAIQIHFHQKEQIELLEKKVKELEPKASLSIAFATKLNHLLEESDLKPYHPELHLVQALGYQNMNDKNSLWIEFPTFKKEKIYGLIFRGYTAGIIKEQSNQPLALLQSDKESIFSVFIGKNNIQGIAYGNGETLMIKYIPNYENPKVGDEVLTSGNDNIFYAGIKVGKVTAVGKKNMYKIATIQPYAKLKNAQFFYAVEVK